MKFKLTIKNKDIQKGRTQVIEDAAKSTQLKGFRKGKAPLDRVEAVMGEKDIIEKTFDKILPKAYADEIIEKKLKPITMPKIIPVSIEKDKDWVLDVQIAQRPSISLGEYKKLIKKSLEKVKPDSTTKAAEPKKDKKSEKSSKTTKKPTAPKAPPTSERDQKIKVVFDTLLENIQVKISPLLIEEEVNNQLNRLADQIQKLGLTVESYLASMKTSEEKLRKEYEKTAEENLKLEFILDEISRELKIKATPKELEDLLAGAGSKEAAERIKSDPREMSSVNHMIEKRKTIDKLINGDL